MTKEGELEAKLSGELLRKENFEFDIVYTSVLKRANKTLTICLKEMNIANIPIFYEWRLNERHYGGLQGLNKAEMAKKYGQKQVFLWRRSYDTPPPKLDKNDQRHPRYDTKYQNLKKYDLPSGECLKDTVMRVTPLWKKHIVSKILSGQKILIVAHGNSLRAIIKILDQLSDKEIININIPTGIPLIYELDEKLIPLKKYYLGEMAKVSKKLDNIIAQGKPK